MKTTTCEGFETVWYMCYYFKWGTSDYISRQIMDFKAGDKLPIKSFSELAAYEFKLLGEKFDYIIRVLGSEELIALKPNKVREVALEIQKQTGGMYLPQAISKHRVTRQLKTLSKDARRRELDGVYFTNKNTDLNGKRVLVVDDIFTFGTSFEAIGKVLKTAYPKVKLFGFSIAHNWQKDEEGISINELTFRTQYAEKLQALKSGNQ